MAELAAQQARYADLLVRLGLNLQPGQALRIGAELEHRGLERLIAEKAYDAGARLVVVDWADTPLAKTRYQHSRAEFLDFVPDYEVARHQEMLDERWARLGLAGAEFP